MAAVLNNLRHEEVKDTFQIRSSLKCTPGKCFEGIKKDPKNSGLVSLLN